MRIGNVRNFTDEDNRMEEEAVMSADSVTFEEELNRSGRLAYTNVGVSMMPLIREGRDVLVIEKRDVKEIRRLDAVLFRRRGVTGRGAYVLHRILKVLPDGKYWIIGDNCTSGEIVAAEDVLGVLTQVGRGEKTVYMTDLSYRIYVFLWCRPYRLRIFVQKVVRFGKRGLRFLKRRIIG